MIINRYQYHNMASTHVYFNKNKAAHYHRCIVSTIGINIAAVFFLGGVIPETGIMVLYIPFLCMYSFFSFHLANALGKSGLLWAVLTIIPISSFVCIVVLLHKCSKTFETAGLKIRLFGGVDEPDL